MHVDAANIELSVQTAVLESIIDDKGFGTVLSRIFCRFETIWARNDIQASAFEKFGLISKLIVYSKQGAVFGTAVASAADPQSL